MLWIIILNCLSLKGIKTKNREVREKNIYIYIYTHTHTHTHTHIYIYIYNCLHLCMCLAYFVIFFCLPSVYLEVYTARLIYEIKFEIPPGEQKLIRNKIMFSHNCLCQHFPCAFPQIISEHFSYSRHLS
jgi:hypothetical protein